MIRSLYRGERRGNEYFHGAEVDRGWISAAAAEYFVPVGIRVCKRFLHGQCAGSSRTRPRPLSGFCLAAAPRYSIPPRRRTGCRFRIGFVVGRGLPGPVWEHAGSPLGLVAAHQRGAAGYAAAIPIRMATRGNARRQMANPSPGICCVLSNSDHFARCNGNLSESVSGRGRLDPKSIIRPDHHGRRRRRHAVSVLSFLGKDERGRHHSRELLHGFGSLRRMSQGYF